MGEAADRKVREIEQARDRLEGDLRELQGRMPAAARTGKRVVAGVAGSTVAAGVVRMLIHRRRKKRQEHDRTTEVVVRVVREDQPTT
jgi:hypothetical protein